MDDLVPAKSAPEDRRSQCRYLALAMIVGMVAGAIGSLFHLALNTVLQWPTLLHSLLDGPLLVLTAALITMAATLAAVALVRHVAPEAAGSGVQEVEGAMEGLRQVHGAKVLPVKFLGGVAAIGSGLVLGRGGPTIHIGASVAAMLAARFRLDATERSGLLAAGAAAGLACAFNAPVAGVLFVIEETRRQFPYRFSTYTAVIIAALLATVMTQLIGGTGADLTLSLCLKWHSPCCRYSRSLAAFWVASACCSMPPSSRPWISRTRRMRRRPFPTRQRWGWPWGLC